MANELAVQTEIKQAVIAQGGYAVKLSNRFTIGIPDLGIWLGPYDPFIMEVKDFGVVAATFNRQIGTTPKQRDTMRRMQQSYGNDVWGEHVCGEAVIERSRTGLKWDIYRLLDKFGARR
jgi:hypothetical protein